jgi:hypothetical protein
MIGKLLLGKLFTSAEEAEAHGDGAFNGGTEIKLRVTDWAGSTLVCAVEWYSTVNRKPDSTSEVHWRPYVLMPGRTITAYAT